MRIRSVIVFCCFFVSLFLSKKANATHIMGGEITWECLNSGQYVFTLKIYRDCNGVSFTSNGHQLETHNYPNLGAIGSIPMNFFSVIDITPSCEGSPCSTLSQSDPDIQGAIEEYILKSNPITLNGVPGVNGWIFTWTYGDRNAAIDNMINAQNYGITLRAKMFNYNGRNANACFDSSPDFYQKPSTIICAGEKFVYNHSAFDNELDSLAYSWARPLDGQYCNPPPCSIGGLFQEGATPTHVPFDLANNFSFNNPYPDVNLDARNVPAVLNPNTGEITFTSYNAGEFVSIIKVEAFKCGIKVAEVYRELQTVITSGCASNEPPDIPPPFANGTFRDTVKVGDVFSFDINVFDTLRMDNPKTDSIFFYASGLQFGTNFTSTTTGCLNPPCATLTRALPDTAVGNYTTHFNWQTTCDHLADNTPTCINSQNTYIFVLRAFDDFCPAAGQTIASISLTILAKERVIHPDIHCADVQSNGNVIIDWNQSPDPDLSFKQWKIYRSTNRNAPYTLIDSISNYNTTTYIDINAGANSQSVHYIVRAESGCNSDWLFMNTDTISSMYINPTFNNDCITVDWNTLDSPLPNGSGALYDVYREYPIGSGFSLYKTIAANSFCDTFRICADTVTYIIFLSNMGNGCIGSSSNIKGVRFQNPILNASSSSLTNVSCNGLNDAIAFVSPTGGTTPYTFLWSNNQTSDTARSLIANTFTVTITDNQGCTTTSSVNITEPTTL
ncbi:MAG: SprB repeat-containing protein, partial [Flavobacteriales bacterium]|nr:SprB repeat-containing protein [Flavobacteriales bacterium]